MCRLHPINYWPKRQSFFPSFDFFFFPQNTCKLFMLICLIKNKQQQQQNKHKTPSIVTRYRKGQCTRLVSLCFGKKDRVGVFYLRKRPNMSLLKMGANVFPSFPFDEHVSVHFLIAYTACTVPISHPCLFLSLSVGPATDPSFKFNSKL